MATVALQVLHQNACAVWLEANTIVAVVDDRVLDDDVGAPVSVPTVGILGLVVTLAVTTDCDVAEDNIAAVGNKVVVLGRIPQIQIGYGAALQTNGAEEHRAQDIDVGCVEVVPDLAVAIYRPAAVDIHVIATELEECGGILEGLVEGVGLPVISVVGELDVPLDVFFSLSAYFFCNRIVCNIST